MRNLLELLDHNGSRATELARQLYSPGSGVEGPQGAVSFLESSAGRAVPKNRHFTLGCRCAEDVYIKSSNALPVNLPLSSCASNYIKVTRIYTPGCPPNETHVCSERLLALDKRVQRYFAPGLAWRIRWTKVSEHHFSDFSGSTHQPVLGTPGGDLAEFVVALAVYEGMALVTLTEPAVLALLRKFLSVSNKRTFYFHTERSSLEEIARLMRLDYLDVRLPEKDQRQRLLTELTYPGQNGCRHFRHMLAYPGEYEVRRELVVACIAAFFELLWDRDDPSQLWKRLRLVVFTEDREKAQEQAVTFIKGYQECIDYGIAPLIPPRRGRMPVAVLHKQAAALMRSEMADWIGTMLTEDVSAAQILEAIQSLAELHAQNTLRHVFKGRLPVYDVSLQIRV